jgi:HAD superfamily hydrolase (TIGR01509 family)
MDTTPLRPKLPFDALVFDVGGIFILHDNERLFRRLAESCTAPDAVARIRAEANDPAITTGARAVDALHRDLVRNLGYARDWHGFLADWSSHFSVDRALLDLLAELARDHRVILFSNTNRAHWDHVTQFEGGALGRYEAYLSHEIGDRKPNASAFCLVAARAGIEPRRSLFVDDLDENVAAARTVGFHSYVYTGQNALERALAEF